MRTKRAAIYLRVSTGGQDLTGQETELRQYAERRGWEVTAYSDKISGTADRRPALDQLLRDCHSRKIEVVAVWRIDRLGRSVAQVLRELETFRSLGIEFVSLSEQIDTSTPAGRMVFTVIAAVAEMERSLIVERVRMGIANAKRHGKRFGRPPKKKLSTAEITAMQEERARGATVRQVAERFGCSIWAAHQVTKKGSGPFEK